eukprot:c24505_g1_i1 orf=720-2648(+)
MASSSIGIVIHEHENGHQVFHGKDTIAKDDVPLFHGKHTLADEDVPLENFATPTMLLSQNSVKGSVPPDARHSRSKSAPENTLNLLIEEMAPQFTQVSNINKRLKIDRYINHTLEEEEEERQSTGLGLQVCRTITSEAKDLVEEITFLEEEIADLEQYVLTLYRGLFNECLSRSSSVYYPKNKSGSLDKRNGSKILPQDHTSKELSKEKMPSHNSVCLSGATQSSSTSKIVPTVHSKTRHAPMLCESVDVARHCQVPISKSPQQIKALKSRTVKSILSLDEDSPRPLKDYLSESPNHLSEDLVRCMTNIYCKISVSPPAPSLGVPESPLSCTSSSTSLSSNYGMFSDGWSPGSRNELSYDAPLVDPFRVKGNLRWTGAYHNMVEVPHICTDKDRLSSTTRMLRSFRLMVEKLENVDPSQLKHNEKLAFWINIYNALIMHTYLAYGIPRSNLKRMSLLQKASYKVGGHSINAHTVEHYILRLRSHRTTQWLQNLLSTGSKFKSGDGRRAFAIDKPEPLVCFALCCGGRSDPAVRVYTARHVHEELETSMREYLDASIGFQNGRKVLFPKLLEWYAREASLSSSNVLDWVAQYVNEQDKEKIRRCVHAKPHKSATHCIEWVPYNFGFRYILHRELTTTSPSCLH